ncbi:hypothetical protein BN389_20950 [Listeria monocytogenes serotype 4b str. LL195]|nr:hypothetical protein O167_13380 [Listeria monocytogenes serotype 4bV str. LS642]KHK09437.1 hypothetical protein I794_07115 [Listeria monocytogenes SHL002]KHK22078.1 hypothetical protein I615_09135 [Listeria monocytogenes SHL007]KHK22973.1 hypothetical protein I616_07326 [Listeria monocytogenes SHL008]KHK33983.1 hypothetical protein I621_09363 [Listeria monocytogenes SHL012]CCO64669.1 hypothetical protein BN389_20950 [Listeria monocytogenes serotype 4b str. LL195]
MLINNCEAMTRNSLVVVFLCKKTKTCQMKNNFGTEKLSYHFLFLVIIKEKEMHLL